MKRDPDRGDANKVMKIMETVLDLSCAGSFEKTLDTLDTVFE